MSDSEERKEDISREISKLLEEYATILNAERTGNIEPLAITGWVCFSEYETGTLMAEESTAQMNLFAPGQARAMSRGLYEHGADAYRG